MFLKSIQCRQLESCFRHVSVKNKALVLCKEAVWVLSRQMSLLSAFIDLNFKDDSKAHLLNKLLSVYATSEYLTIYNFALISLFCFDLID